MGFNISHCNNCAEGCDSSKSKLRALKYRWWHLIIATIQISSNLKWLAEQLFIRFFLLSLSKLHKLYLPGTWRVERCVDPHTVSRCYPLLELYRQCLSHVHIFYYNPQITSNVYPTEIWLVCANRCRQVYMGMFQYGFVGRGYNGNEFRPSYHYSPLLET